MKTIDQKITLMAVLLAIMVHIPYLNALAGDNVFSVEGEKTYLNGEEFIAVGLRCSNALISDETVDDFLTYVDQYRWYGVNTISVFFMGSRFGDVKGYYEDGSLNPEYARRMGRIIEACDARGMVVLVGCLYWGNSKAKWEGWTQEEANNAVRSTVEWLSENDYRNVFVDPDNEGMAKKAIGISVRELISVAKEADSTILVGYNVKNDVPEIADLGIHFAKKTEGKPYIETEGTPPEYWGEYSKEKDLYGYINVGIYSPGKKEKQLHATDKHLKNGNGYLLASTWLQDNLPNFDPGGNGTPCKPGIRWWLEHIQANYANGSR